MISRRTLLWALSAASCTKNPRTSLVTRSSAFNALPRRVVGGANFEPWRYEGKVVLVTFFATWCFPCLTEMVVLQRLEHDYGSQGFENVLVGMDLEGPAVLEPFTQVYTLKAPVLEASDALRAGESVFGRIRELPSRFLFARSGELVAGYAGVAPYPDLKRLVEAALK